MTIDPHTVYVVTRYVPYLCSMNVQLSLIRWWRAPEVLISDGEYNEKVDIWSVGCIMAQLICLKSIFDGKDTLDQLRQISELTGIPNDATLTSMGCKPSLREIILQNNVLLRFVF